MGILKHLYYIIIVFHILRWQQPSSFLVLLITISWTSHRPEKYLLVHFLPQTPCSSLPQLYCKPTLGCWCSICHLWWASPYLLVSSQFPNCNLPFNCVFNQSDQDVPGYRYFHIYWVLGLLSSWTLWISQNLENFQSLFFHLSFSVFSSPTCPPSLPIQGFQPHIY